MSVLGFLFILQEEYIGYSDSVQNPCSVTNIEHTFVIQNVLMAISEFIIPGANELHTTELVIR
jgi:hypothetical protein